MRWVNKYNKNKTVKRKSRKAVSYKVTQQHIKYIKTQIKTNKTISMQELSNSIEVVPVLFSPIPNICFFIYYFNKIKYLNIRFYKSKNYNNI
jgi:hypothetical protein